MGSGSLDRNPFAAVPFDEAIERGTHQALLALGGHYAGMWNRQREAAEARAKLLEAEREELEEAG